MNDEDVGHETCMALIWMMTMSIHKDTDHNNISVAIKTNISNHKYIFHTNLVINHL